MSAFAQHERASYFNSLAIIEEEITKYELSLESKKNDCHDSKSSDNLQLPSASPKSAQRIATNQPNLRPSSPSSKLVRSSVESSSQVEKRSIPRLKIHPTSPGFIPGFGPGMHRASNIAPSFANIRLITVKSRFASKKQFITPSLRMHHNNIAISIPITQARLALLSGTRIYVRVGLARKVKVDTPRSEQTEQTEQSDLQSDLKIRKLARSHLNKLTRELQQCYLNAITRDPWLATRIEVEIGFANEDISYSRLSDGTLIDEQGDRCITTAIEGAKTKTSGEQRLAGLDDTLRIPIRFFYAGKRFRLDSIGSPINLVIRTFNRSVSNRRTLNTSTISRHPLAKF